MSALETVMSLKHVHNSFFEDTAFTHIHCGELIQSVIKTELSLVEVIPKLCTKQDFGVDIYFLMTDLMDLLVFKKLQEKCIHRYMHTFSICCNDLL